MDFFKRNIIKHISLLILVSGAGGLYVSNIILYFMLNTYDYSKYSLLSAFLSVVVVFSGFGFDQVIIRYSNVKGNVVDFSRMFILPSFFLVIISSFIFSFVFSKYFFYGDFIYLTIISILCGIILYQFTVLRLSSNFSEAQLLKNLWKILFPILAFCFYFFSVLNISSVIYILIFLLFSTVCVGFLYTRKVEVKFMNGISFDWKLLFGYFFATIIMTYMSTSDRFLIDITLDEKKLALYFLIQNIFLFPFSQLQNYFGFKDVVAFKKKINMSLLRSRVARNLKFSFLVSILLLILSGILVFFIKSDYSMKIYDNIILILIFLITGIIKVVYSSLSAAMSVFADHRTINFVNIVTIIFISVCTYFLLQIEESNLIAIAFVFMLFWLQRSSLFYFQLKRGLNEI